MMPLSLVNLEKLKGILLPNVKAQKSKKKIKNLQIMIVPSNKFE